MEQKSRRQIWWKAALVTAAIILPFGTVILLITAVGRARRARRAEDRYAEWWRLRDQMRSKPAPSPVLFVHEFVHDDDRELAERGR